MRSNNDMLPEDIAIHSRLGWSMWDQEARTPSRAYLLREYARSVSLVRVKVHSRFLHAHLHADPSRADSFIRFVSVQPEMA